MSDAIEEIERRLSALERAVFPLSPPEPALSGNMLTDDELRAWMRTDKRSDLPTDDEAAIIVQARPILIAVREAVAKACNPVVYVMNADFEAGWPDGKTPYWYSVAEADKPGCTKLVMKDSPK